MNGKFLAAILMIPMLGFGWWGFFSTVGQRSILQCQRSTPLPQIATDCTLTHRNWLTQPQAQPVAVTTAIVDVQAAGRYRGESYRVMLVTTTERIPLTEVYFDRYESQAKLSEQINQFLQSTEPQLVLKVNAFGGVWWLGLLLIAFSLKALELFWSAMPISLSRGEEQTMQELYGDRNAGKYPKRK